MTRTIIAAALTALTTASCAHADGDVPKQIVVAYGDLDLGTAAGKSELKVRLQAAAAQLCSPVLPGRDYRGSDEGIHELKVVYYACIGRLSERAMAKVQISRN
jgi:UrcA family protein